MFVPTSLIMPVVPLLYVLHSGLQGPRCCHLFLLLLLHGLGTFPQASDDVWAHCCSRHRCSHIYNNISTYSACRSCYPGTYLLYKNCCVNLLQRGGLKGQERALPGLYYTGDSRHMDLPVGLI